MQLQLCTWPDVERYLTHSSGVIIPVGSTEQHGPTGVIGTDAICAEQICLAAADGYDDMLLAPTLAISPAQFNLGFPGTISLRAATFMQVVTDTVESLARSGFTHFYFLNGHGANLAAVRSALHDLHQTRSIKPENTMPELKFRMRSWWDFAKTDALRKNLYGDREGMHATPSEISITQSALGVERSAQSSIDYQKLHTSFYQNHAQDSHDDARAHRSRFPDGHVGSDPSLSSAEHGQQLLDTAAGELRADWLDFLDENN